MKQSPKAPGAPSHLINLLSWLFASQKIAPNKFRYRKVFSIAGFTLFLACLSAGFTATAAIYAEKWETTLIGSWLVAFNEFAMDESLDVKVALSWIGASLAPFAIVAILAMMAPPKEKSRILRAIYGSYEALPGRFPPVDWLSYRTAAAVFLRIGDLLCAKVGASIAGTVLGVCIYLLFQGQHVVMVTIMSFFSWYTLSVFPKWTRSVLVRRYAIELPKWRAHHRLNNMTPEPTAPE